MKIVIFGLTISSSWGNGHATLWRGLCKALIQSGHDIVFYERNVPYYAEMRDLNELPGGRLELYEDSESVRRRATLDLTDADVAIITSYCPDSPAANDRMSSAIQDSPGSKRAYDLSPNRHGKSIAVG